MAKQPKPLKIGIVCEGQPDGAEEKVLPRLIRLICPRAIWDIVPSGNRPSVLAKAPNEAKRLLEGGCTIVFVMWDVFPEWRDHGGTADCKDHLKILDDGMKAANMSGKPVIPVAVHEELEAWLLADGDALSAAMSTPAHKVRVGHEKHPDGVDSPKATLRKLFETKKVGTYNESVHAGKIAAKLTSTKRLEQSQSFKRFADAVRKVCPSL